MITGSKGQLAKEFIKFLTTTEHDFTAFDIDEINISNLNDLLKIFDIFKPDIVINCAAYSNVDLAESEFELAYKTNSLGVRNLSFACRETKAKLIHFSTDYIFDGKKETGLYVESDKTSPLNIYGKTKQFGEVLLTEEMNDYLIFRVSWLFGDGQQNFISKLFTWQKSNEFLKVSCDEFSSPTSTTSVVDITFKAINEGLTGIFHINNTGYCSRFEWAKKIFRTAGLKTHLYPAYMADFKLPAKRPLCSAMSNQLITSTLDIPIPDWEEEVQKFVIKFVKKNF